LKTVRKLIIAKRLAPLYPGIDENQLAKKYSMKAQLLWSETSTTTSEDETIQTVLMSSDLEECPICLLYYPGGLNRSLCCKKGVCSECFLQLKKTQRTPSTLSILQSYGIQRTFLRSAGKRRKGKRS